jgi:DNA-binding CsgD family transcriptional regulator
MSESLARTRASIPAEVTPFIGRERELDLLGHWMEDRTTRLITIVGMGGMGKTRLAQEIARRQIGYFEDGVFSVPFAGSDDLLNPIANAIGLRLTAIDNPLQELKNYLSRGHMLLVLDNFEHLINQGALIIDLLSAAPLCKIIVTSRQRLNLRGETLLTLTGMEVEAWPSLAQASDAGVIQLFRFSARRGRPDFEISEQSFRRVAEICGLVDGMPLGVELAASWLSALTLEEIASGIRESVDFLNTEFQDVPERHRRMRTVLEQSLHLLPEVEQRIFVQLCVFYDGFTLEAAKAVTGVDFGTLSMLVNKSLIQRDLQGRYTIHELLRQFGQEVLDLVIFTHHARYYCRLLADLDNELISGDIAVACRWIEPEFGNIRSAWEWASSHEMLDELIASSTPLACFREYSCRFIECYQVYDAAIAHLRQSAASSMRDVVLAHILGVHSWAPLRFGHLEQGLQMAQESWDLFTRNHLLPIDSSHGDPRHSMTALLTLLGNLDAARQVGQEALSFYSERDDLLGLGMACYTLTVVELAAGNHRAVSQYGIRGYEAFRKAKHPYVQAYLLMNWANSERALGNIDEAKRLFAESYDNMCAVGTIVGQATALTHVAQIALVQGEYEEARRIFMGNVEIFRQIGDSGGLAASLEGLAQIAIAQKQPRQAAHLLVEALDITGIRLQSYTLSLLLCACQLPLKAELRAQISSTIQSHPAANEGTKRKMAAGGADQPVAPPPLEQLVAEMKRYLATFAAQANHPDSLTEREMDILRLLAEGLPNQEIANRLVMTVGTIKWYLNRMYTKLQVKNRTEAVNRARKLNLLS